MSELRVSGGATREELAAVVAVLNRRPADDEDAYTRWRRVRLAALRRTTDGDVRG